MEKWNFPENGNGQIRGYADAGIETFNGDEIKALAREICQNSLDALREGKDKIVIEFYKYIIDSSSIPGYKEYRQVIEKCKNYWKDINNKKVIEFFNEALRQLKQEKTSILRISDYNTKGLLGPYDNRLDGWNALTKIDGGATKTGDKAGSFGIGKNAPFCNSYYRLVFYRTLNEENIKAAQGISRLVSFPKNEDGSFDTMTTGIGYYGNPQKNSPVETILELDKLCKRDKVGTDVFVYGFKSGSSWIDEICKEIIDNFLVSIYNNKMEIKIQNEILNSNTLEGYINKYKTNKKNAYCSYLLLTKKDEVKNYELNFHGMGTLKLSVLVDEKEEKLNKKILVVRTSGMKLFYLDRMPNFISFSGILELEGKELNEYFREMETPNHDSWKPTRHSNPKEAKKYYNELKEWVKKILLSLGEHSSGEEIEVKGLGDILQEKLDELPAKDKKNKPESIDGNTIKILIPEIKKEKTTKGLLLSNSGANNNPMNKVSGRITPDGDKNATRYLKGKRKRSKRVIHKGVEDPMGRDIVYSPKASKEDCELNDIRIIKIDSGKYRLSFSLSKNLLSGHIEVVTVGENGGAFNLKIDSASGVNGCYGIKVVNNQIKFNSMSASTKVKIEFKLIDSHDYAMEVNVYEDNK